MSHADPRSPWSEAAAALSAGAPLLERLRFLVRYAVLAPSGHNTQPWAFRVLGDAIELRADRSRGLPIADPRDREPTISCGAALFNLQLSARRFGLRSALRRFPDPADPDLLARLRVTGSGDTDDGEVRRLFDQIPHRHTNRRPFEPRPVPTSLVAALEDAAAAEGAWLVPLDEKDKLRAAELIAAGDRQQMSDKRFRRELAEWLVSNRSDRPDGMPGYAQGLGDLASHFGPLVVRTFDVGKSQAARDAELATGSPLLVVLGTDHDAADDWLAAGMALERVLLRARTDAVHASYLNQPIQVEALRPHVSQLCRRDGYPQVLLRLGYGPDVLPTPRRPANDVLIG